MLPCTELVLGVTKHCLFADTELSNKVELLVFSATKGRDSFTAILASASGVPSCDTANIRVLQYRHGCTLYTYTPQQALPTHSCVLENYKHLASSWQAVASSYQAVLASNFLT